MHDPCTLAFDIYLGRKEKKNGHYNTPFITIWHRDPEKDGTDDSCGWFIRSRHIDKKLMAKVRREFEFQFKHNYWFNSKGQPKFSTQGIVLNMYNLAVWNTFMYFDNNKPSDRARRRYHRFMRKYIYDILYFAENPTDSLYDSVNRVYESETVGERIDYFTSVVMGDIMRKLRPWYKHPRWHIRHWQVRFPVFRSWYRRYFQRCDLCHGKIGTQSVYTDWDGTKHWCNTCNNKRSKPVPHE